MNFGSLPMAGSIAEVGGNGKSEGGRLRGLSPAAGTGPPMASPKGYPAPKAPRQWHSNGVQSLSVQTVPQCAPCARTQGRSLALPLAERCAQTARYRIGLGKGRFSTNPFSAHPTTSPFLLRDCPIAKHCFALGARTGRALRHCLARSKGKAKSFPLARGLRGGGRRARPL